MIKILILLFIAFVCGSIGAKLAGSGGKGCITSIALGFIGALLGGWLRGQLDMPEFLYIKDIPVVWSIIGAAIFVALINLVSGRGSAKG